MRERFFRTKHKLSLRIAAGFLYFALFSETSLAASFSVNYSGRLTRSDGSPVEGPVSIQVKFWSSSTDGAQIGQTLDYSGINLSSGVFALDLVFTADQVTAVFGDGSSPVYLELTSQNITYPRQQFSYVPFALRVPVDSKMLTFDEDGKLTFTAGAKLGANQFLTTGTDGKLIWAAPLAPTIQNQAIATGIPSSGQVLTYNGSQWASSNPIVSTVNLTTGVTGTLAVSKGGTGATSFANNGVLIGAGNLPVSTATGSQHQVLTSGAGGALGFGAVNLEQSAAVSGVLPTANGGTGVNSTATFPASGVVVTRDDTETLTNKTITTATINGSSKIGGSTEINTTGAIASGAANIFGNVTVRGNGTGSNKLILNDKGSNNFVAFKAPDTLVSSITWELPGADGSAGQVLATNGSGTLSWASGLAPVGAAGGDLTGAFPNPALIDVGTAGAYSKVVVDSKGRVTSGGILVASDIPNLSANQITSGILNSVQLPTAGTAGTYAKVTTDDYGRVIAGSTLSASDIPPISAALITSGTLDSAQLPTLGTAGTYAKVTTDAYGRVTSGTTLASSDLTSALGFTPLNKAGDTIGGALNLGSNDLLSAGNIQMAASKTFALSGNTSDPAGLVSDDKGKTWFNTVSNVIKYWDGATTQTLGAVGASVTSLNGLTGATQTFATPGTTGTAPTWSSAANAHTLNIPLASKASVTSGLISYSDYTTFNGKVAGVTSGTGVTVSTTGNIATVNLETTGTAGTFAKVITDAYGRVSSGTTLVAADLPPHSAALITSGTLSVANGGTGVTSTPTNGQVLIGNGSNFALSTLTAGTGVSIANAAGEITIAATADTSTKVSKTGDTMTGALTMPLNGLIAGTSQLVLANGNVGIGSASPGATLDLLTTSAASQYAMITALQPNLPVNGINYINLGTSASNNNQGALYFRNVGAGSANNTMSIGFYGTGDRLAVTAGGNVGIGTTAPSGTFQVNSSSGTGALITRSDITSGNYGNIVTQRSLGTMAAPLALDTPRTFGGITFSGYDGIVYSTFLSGPGLYGVTTQGWTTTAHGSGIYLTTTPNDSTTAAERMRIDHSGNVGIGTTAPAARFHLGNSSLVTNPNSYSVGTNGEGLLISDQEIVSYGSERVVDFVALGLQNGAAGGSGFRFMTNPANSNSAVERVRITASGNVGIGTTSPAAKLEVSSTTSGFLPPRITSAQRTAISSPPAGLMVWDTTTNSIQVYNGSSWTELKGGDATPTGTIAYFDLASCPTGWSERTDVRGRYIVGMPSGGTRGSGSATGTALSNMENRAVGQHSHSINDPGHSHGTPWYMAHDGGNWWGDYGGGGEYPYNQGTYAATTGVSINNAGSVAGTNAPYIQFLVCKKD